MVARHVVTVDLGHLHVRQIALRCNHFARARREYGRAIHVVSTWLSRHQAVSAQPPTIEFDDVRPVRLPPIGLKAWNTGGKRHQVRIDATVAAAVDDQVAATLEGERQFNHCT